MRFTDFLKATVLLTAGEATALGALTVLVAGANDDLTAIIFGLSWWLIAAIIGAWAGRRTEITRGIGGLLAAARMENALPEIRPVSLMLNRLWPLAVIALIAVGVAWLYPQVAAVATGFLVLSSLAWRKQEKAVTAIEDRDGARFYVVKTSPFRRIELIRTPGLRRIPAGNGAAPS